jgi:hypothetical protein
VKSAALVIAMSCVELASQSPTHWTQLRLDGVGAHGRSDYRQAEKALLASKQEAESSGVKTSGAGTSLD